MRKLFSENWRRADADPPPEGAAPLLWELGQLRKVAQDALAHAARTRNLSATASLLRSANGLLDFLSKIEKAKTEELKAQQAKATLQDEEAVREEFDRWLDALRERMLAAQAAAPKCPRCGQALPYGVQVEEEEPKPPAPGCIDEGGDAALHVVTTRHWPLARSETRITERHQVNARARPRTGRARACAASRRRELPPDGPNRHDMKIGVVFPQIEIGTDPAVVRDYAQAAESLGYDYLLIFDHVIGANTASRPKWTGPYTSAHSFHEPFVVFGYIAACTQRVELVTGVIILPQRQTVLVAKQAAEVDVLSGGRVRLGIGVGWNDVEYEALGMDFHTRGARSVEQIKVLRALWTQETVTFEGRWHRIPDAGINPLPVQRPIPLWIGGESEVALRRAARIADGWMSSRTIQTPAQRPAAEPGREHQVERLRAHLAAAGRSPSTFGIEGRAAVRQGGPDEWHLQIEQWRKLGATHLSVDTMRAGLSTPRAHIDAIRRFHDATSVG